MSDSFAGFEGPGSGFGGFGGPGFGGPGFGGPGFGGPGFGGPGFGPGGFGLRIKRAVTASLLLDGPASATEIVQRVSDATEGEITLPEPVVERVLERLTHRGVVKTEDGVATLTEFGRKLLAKRGITSQTAQALRAKLFPKLVNVLKLRSGLTEIAGLARVIAVTGTDEQKQKLAEASATLLTTVNEVKRSLQSAVA
jgi:DNA-binding PadR family transcriptional regulator